MLFCGLWSSFLPSAPLSQGSGLPVQPGVSLTDGRGGLCLAEVALAAGQATLHDQATHHAGLDLLKVIRLCADFGLQKADVCFIPSLLLRERGGREESEIKRRWNKSLSPQNWLFMLASKYIHNYCINMKTDWLKQKLHLLSHLHDLNLIKEAVEAWVTMCKINVVLATYKIYRKWIHINK